MSDNSLLDANRKLKRQVQNKHESLKQMRAVNARLCETLRRVVKEARRQHSSLQDEIRERDYLVPCKLCGQPPVVDIDIVPPDGPETTTFIYCETNGCPNTEEDELEGVVMCFEDSQALWNYRNDPRTNWIAAEIEKGRDEALAEVERLRELIRGITLVEKYTLSGKVWLQTDWVTPEEWAQIQEIKGESDD